MSYFKSNTYKTATLRDYANLIKKNDENICCFYGKLALKASLITTFVLGSTYFINKYFPIETKVPTYNSVIDSQNSINISSLKSLTGLENIIVDKKT